MFLARYEFRNILEVRSVSKCTACTQMYFSNLMDADRLYNNFVGQEMNVQPTSENSELAVDLCGGKSKMLAGDDFPVFQKPLTYTGASASV